MPVWKLDDGILLGKILKPYGYRGFVRVAFFISGLEKILSEGKFIFIEWIGKPVPYLIEEILWDDDKTARLKFTDIDNLDDASKLIGRSVILSEKSVPKRLLKSLEPVELVGYKVIDAQNKLIGFVTGLDESGRQSILEVSQDEKEFLIPFHEDLVKSIDPKRKEILVDLPEGLLDL
jgi:16S rRNA processing protein RimM